MSQPLCYSGGFYTRNFITLYLNREYVTSDFKVPGEQVTLLGKRKKGYPLQPVANAAVIVKAFVGFIDKTKHQTPSYVWTYGTEVAVAVTDIEGGYRVTYTVPDTSGLPINLNVYCFDGIERCTVASNDDIIYVSPPQACSIDAQCPSGFACVDGICVPNPPATGVCSIDSDCAEGYVCVDGECIPEGTLGVSRGAGGLVAAVAVSLAVVGSLIWMGKEKK